MSRIGKQPVPIPPKVKVQVQDNVIVAEGPKGRLEWQHPVKVRVRVENGNVLVEREGDDAQAKALHGLTRAIINNMVRGVSEGFVKKLEIHGVGFRAAVQGKVLNLQLGYSHPVEYSIPDQIKITVEDNTKLTIEGPDKWRVGLVAAQLRAKYPPEPYKGKGIRYVGEHIQRKEGKTVQ
jgi:large subunit ribosomal protein L6